MMNEQVAQPGVCRYPLRVDAALPIADVKSHAWLHGVELTFIARSEAGFTSVLCRTEGQAQRLRQSLKKASGDSLAD